jgi:AraC-like DNA-binding protein
MKKADGHIKKHTASWHVDNIKGLECFRACNMIHHFRRHSHEGYTIGIIENGFGDNHYRGSVFHLNPGKIVVMNPEEIHTGTAVSEHPWSYRMFYINEEVFKEIFPEKHVLPFFHGLCFEDDYWYEKLHNLHCMLESNLDGLYQQTIFTELLSGFAQTFGMASFPDVSGNEPKAVRTIKDFINAHFQRNISIDDLVNITQLSRGYLIRSFKRCVGIPPYAYLIQTRINHAKKLLAKKVPVAQVAYDIGFSDQSHLTRFFKSITGITPKQYAIGHCS